MYRLQKKWSYGLADWEYILEEINDRGETVKVLSHGNQDWALRHSKHYDIKMPEEEQ